MGIQFNSEKMNLLAHCLLASILACLFLDNVVRATSTKELLKFPTEREASLKEFDNSLSQSPIGDAPTLIVSTGSVENIDQPEEDNRSRVPRSPMFSVFRCRKGSKKCRKIGSRIKRESRIKSLEEQQMEFEGHLRGRRAADRSKFHMHQFEGHLIRRRAADRSKFHMHQFEGHLRGRRAADRSKFHMHQWIKG